MALSLLTRETYDRKISQLAPDLGSLLFHTIEERGSSTVFACYAHSHEWLLAVKN